MAQAALDYGAGMSQIALLLESSHPNARQALRFRPIPSPAAGQIQVKLHATAVNPVDYKVYDHGIFLSRTRLPIILGTDGAGEVTALGSGATRFTVGDRVLYHGQFAFQGDTSGGDKATFQQFGIADDAFASKIPDGLDYDSASTIPVGAATAASALYSSIALELTPPWAEGGRGKYAGQTLLVLGGSSSVGAYTVQFAALSGFRVITTSSPKHFSLLRELGASVTLQRDSPTLLNDILASAPDLAYVVDAISLPDTQLLGVEALRRGGKLVRVLAADATALSRATEKDVQILGAHGASHSYPEFFSAFWKAVEEYLSEGLIQPNKTLVLQGGLAAWEEAFALHREGKLSGVKVVLRPGETDRAKVERG